MTRYEKITEMAYEAWRNDGADIYSDHDYARVFKAGVLAGIALRDEELLAFYAELKLSKEYFYKETGEFYYYVVAMPDIETKARQALAPGPLDALLEGEKT